jgi:hypothetical protein
MSAPDLEERLYELHDSLGEFQAADPTPWEIGLIFNALLEEVKSGHSDDPVVRSIGALERSSASSLTVARKLTSPSPGPYARANIGTVRTAVKQILIVVDPEGRYD